jgi:hypothetical protein
LLGLIGSEKLAGSLRKKGAGLLKDRCRWHFVENLLAEVVENLLLLHVL